MMKFLVSTFCLTNFFVNYLTTHLVFSTTQTQNKHQPLPLESKQTNKNHEDERVWFTSALGVASLNNVSPIHLLNSCLPISGRPATIVGAREGKGQVCRIAWFQTEAEIGSHRKDVDRCPIMLSVWAIFRTPVSVFETDFTRLELMEFVVHSVHSPFLLEHELRL